MTGRGNNVPRFRLHRVLEASQDCGVFLLLFFGKKDLSGIVGSKEKLS